MAGPPRPYGAKCSFGPCEKLVSKRGARGLCSGHSGQTWAGKPLTPLRDLSPRKLLPHPAIPGAVMVPLTEGKFAVIDEADAQLVGQFNWCLRPSRDGGTDYAGRGEVPGGTYRAISLHRFLWKSWGLSMPKTIDHEDRDGLNCRRGNLRAATQSQNNSNSPKNRRNTSGFKGVTFNRLTKKWHVRYKHLGQKYYVGEFLNLEEAARAYDAAILPLRGEFAVLNFPSRQVPAVGSDPQPKEMTMATTATTLTDAQISKLRSEAYAAGDYAMGAICDLALTGRFDADEYTTLDRDEARRIATMSRDDAYAACAEAINDAEAQDDAE